MNKTLKTISRKLRKNSTDTENYLWRFLRNRRLENKKFRKQFPTDNYIVDFICLEKRLIIELDGGQHAENIEKDSKRDTYLREKGFTVLRFWDNEIFENTDGVLEKIREHCL